MKVRSWEVFLFSCLLFATGLGIYSGYALVQKTFVLDLNSPVFVYEQNQFNDSSFSKEYDFPGQGNITYWIKIPKNSTILNATFNLTGKITTIYSKLIKSSNIAPWGISIGDVVGGSDKEIVTGTSALDGNISVLYGRNGSVIWTYLISNNFIYDTSIGDITSDPGNEIVAGSADKHVYVLNCDDSGASEAWSYNTSSDVKAVAIGDIDEDGDNEILAGSDKLYVLNSSGNLEWEFELGGIEDLSVGNITSDSGMEIVVGNSTGVSVINSSGSLVWFKYLGTTVNSVDIGNITSDPGNEIVAGGTDDKVYLLNTSDTSGEVVWEYQAGGDIVSVSVGDVIGAETGNEIVAGSDDGKLYTLNSSGCLIWEYVTESQVKSVAIGNITSDEGNETVCGAIDGYIYTFNFDYFPDNVSIDVGADGSYEWNYSGKLRTTVLAGGNSEIINAVQGFLDSCSPDSQGNCEVPFLFHSDWAGKLNISAVNVTYRYNASGPVCSETITAWSRTRNIQVNESVGNQSINISFSYPSVTVGIHYIKVNDSATVCDFNGSRYSVTTVNGEKVCDVPDFTVPVSGNLPGPFLLWDDSMPAGKPVLMNESGTWYTYGTDNYFWRKNLTIWNTTSEVFHSVIANTTLDDSVIREDEYLKVFWQGSWCDITPSSSSSTCNTASPSYQSKTCGSDTFYSCKQDTNSNGVTDFFKWIQPHTSCTMYETGGSTNARPELTDANVTPSQDFWGEGFNFSVQVNDTEGDCVNVSLWIYHPLTGWALGGYENVTGNGTLWFNLTSDMNWVGTNQYNFSYMDYNCSNTSEIYHSVSYTQNYQGPDVQKHNVSVVYIKGNNSVVNRSESVELVVRINDPVNSSWVGENVGCWFWITLNGSEFDSGHYNQTNASGYCMYSFIPDANYTPGNQTWIAGVYNDTYYADKNSTDFVLTVMGKININLISPVSNQTLYRNSSNLLQAKITDEYGNSVNISGYNCSFWFNNSIIGNATTNSTGWCVYQWNPNCTVGLGYIPLNVTVSGNSSEFYFLNDTEDNNPVIMKDVLVVSIDNPVPYSLIHKTEALELNSTVNDTCYLCEESYSVNWHLKWKGYLKIILNETSGLNRINEPVIINASVLESEHIDLSEWPVNHTKARINGIDIPVEIKTWTNESKTEINTSQTYMNNYSELVFLANLTPYQTVTVWVYYNDSNATDYDLNYLENAGFESQSLNPWVCSGINCVQGSTDYCECEIREEGTEPTGNHSAYLSALGVPNNIVSSIIYNFSSGTLTDYIKIVYKTGGDFTSGSYLRLRAGNGTCELNVSQGTWHETLCENASFSNATSIEVLLHDTGNAGASHVYIDYICIADSNGTCINFMTGAELQKNIVSQTHVATGDNTVWVIPSNETVGIRKLLVNASGQYYRFATENVSLQLYGWSNINWSNISSSYCVYNQSFNCSKNATLNILCKIEDANTSQGIQNYNVSFYGDGNCLGYNYTNSEGIAVYTWENSTEAEGIHNVSCVIGDDADIFYNSSVPYQSSTNFTIASGNTTGEIFVSPQSLTTSDNITKTNNYTFYLNITLANNGFSDMYNPEIILSAPSGIYYQNVSCQPLQAGQSCQTESEINVTSLSPLGNQSINLTAVWTNADSTQSNASNITWVFVQNNTVLNITEASYATSIPVGGNKETNITIEAFGNTELKDITFSWSGDNASNVSSWTDIEPSTISLVQKNQNQSVSINITIPQNSTEGVYIAYLTANATGSLCNPDNECWDSVLFNITVTHPDWQRSPEQINKTIGIGSGNGSFSPITITNNIQSNITFNLSLSGNGTIYMNIPETLITTENMSSQKIYIYHNASSSYNSGTWVANLTILSLNSTTPQSLNTTITLNIVNLTIDIISPNTSNPTQPVNVSDIINITVNATYNSEPINDTDSEHQLSWVITVGGENCALANSSYNNITGLWLLQCRAPQIEGNPVYNNLLVNGTISSGSLQGVSCLDEEENAVVYNDCTPPQIWNITVNSVNYFNNVQYIPISTNVTDNTNVSDVWLKINLPNGSAEYLYSYTNVSGIYSFNYKNPNIAGEYTVTVYSNDTHNQTNSSSSWFDVYKPVQFEFNNSYLSDNSTVLFVFYRNGTNQIIHSFETNTSAERYNWTVRKRVYDLKISVYNHTLRFYNLNITQSVISQWSDDGDNLTNPVRFKNIPYQDVGIISLPTATKNKVLGFVIDNRYFNSFSYLNLLLNYSYEYNNLDPSNLNEQRFRIYVCESWNFNTSNCTGSWERNELAMPDIQTHTISANLTSTSAFTIAEHCPECATTETPPSSQQTPSGGGSSGGDQGISPVCGNGVCEAGENEINCPQDCMQEFPFSIKTAIGDIRMHPGENGTYPFYITNNLNKTIRASLSISGEIRNFLTLERSFVQILPNQTQMIHIYVYVPESASTGTYTGTITVSSENKKLEIPVTLRVSLKGASMLSLAVDIITEYVTPYGEVRFSVDMKNTGIKPKLNVSLTYFIKDSEMKETIWKSNESFELEDVLTFTKTLKLNQTQIKPGTYILEVVAEFDSRMVKSIKTFNVVLSFWETPAGRLLPWVSLIVVLGIAGFFTRRKYIEWKLSKLRYLFPVDYNKLPRKSEKAFWIGKIAETNVDAWIDPKDLTTHIIVAGATGAGKSVGASVIVEEALEKKIPVIVFDPTAQWTGFVKACEDVNLLRYYPVFGMNRTEARPYKGMIFEVTDPHLRIDLKKYMNPGEVTVFTLNKLKPGEYDIAVYNIIDCVFEYPWEESAELKLIIVFDEVHRLLEKYGGRGGYVALEKACREFRKWGIGIVMCSQVLADFKEAIAGNVLTEVQLNTKSISDVQKVKNKYGEEYAKRISRQGIGVGMFHNPKYNEGKPYFVHFRPTYHNPHKITNEEMEIYKQFAKKIEIIEKTINDLKAKGKDTFDFELELKLAKDKLKLGRFRMAQIYITSLEQHLNIKGK